MAPMVVDPERVQVFEDGEARHDGLARTHARQPQCPPKRAGNSE